MSVQPNTCELQCTCTAASHATELIVVTGGPGAGKTAILEMAKKHFCQHVAILPEAAGIVFGGGFWRIGGVSATQAAQRAIYHVQEEMEWLVVGEKRWALGLCDRGSLDGLAYWPGSEETFWSQVESDKRTELKKYRSVIHLRTPPLSLGYNHQNALRVESADEAHVIDGKIERIWCEHPSYLQIPSSKNFFEKAMAVLRHIEASVPPCCKIQPSKPRAY